MAIGALEVLLILTSLWETNAQIHSIIPPCNTAGGAFCATDLCSTSRCPEFPNAVCAQRGCDGNCEPEFFLHGVKLSEERCNGGCDGGKFTQWFNRDRPSGYGDYETLVDLRKEFPETICSHPTFVDARSVSSGLPHDMVGQDNKANTERGFWCNNKDNPGTCMDYKVRFCCPDVPRWTDAWTDYFNRDRPTATCDCETMPSLRVEYVGQICEEPTAIDVRLVSNNKPHHTAGQIITHADPKRGFRCDNTETQTCLDYKVRFCCPKVPQPTCEKNGWTAWLNADHPSGPGDYEKLALLRKKYPELICDKPTSIDARVRLTHESYLTVNQDIDINADRGLICVNGLNQRCLDYEVRFCCPNHNIPLPKCKNGKWTDFYNRDKPSGKGDYETLEAHRELAPEEICPNPTNSDVRVARAGASYLTAAQQVEFDPLKGFYCENAAQSGEFCEDYKIRFCCPNECETPVCKDGDWTRFFDIDDPDNEGDIELIENINVVTGGEVCSVPTEIDVRLLNGDHYTTMNQLVHVSVTEGFACYNSDDQTCCDYKVRFCCPKALIPLLSLSVLVAPTAAGGVDLLLPFLQDLHPKSCNDVDRRMLESDGGVYTIYPFEDDTPLQVYCDFTTDGGNWLVFQKRQDGSVDFNRGWLDYAHGFGSLEGEFWLGLENLYRITKNGTYEMRVDMSDFAGNVTFAHYGTFSVGPPDNFTLTLSHFSGPAGHGMTGSGTPFSTYDNDRDTSGRNCAEVYHGGWWFGSCHNGNPNGRYLGGKTILNFGVTWITFRGHYYSLKTIEMKIRQVFP